MEENMQFLRSRNNRNKLQFAANQIVAIDDIPYSFETYKSIDWLNSRHFDYRGLIEKGLALEAPKGMYEKKKE